MVTSKGKIAKIISYLFSPLVFVTSGIELLLIKALKESLILKWQLIVLSSVFLVLPLGFFWLWLKIGRFDIDLTSKKERLRYYVFCLAFGFLGLNLSYYYSWYVFRIFLILMITGLVFMIVTFFSKASLHVGSLTSVYLVLNLLSNWHYFFFLPIIPVVGWARITLKLHDLEQVLEGFIIPWLIIPFGFFILKII